MPSAPRCAALCLSGPGGFFSTDVTLAPAKIVEGFVLRWHVEVTFEEGRRHLGWETQRQWSTQAIARTTPALFGLFCLVCLMAYRLTAGRQLVPQSTKWYLKGAATFAEVLTWVRRALWAEKYVDQSIAHTEQVIFSQTAWGMLMDQKKIDASWFKCGFEYKFKSNQSVNLYD